MLLLRPRSLRLRLRFFGCRRSGRRVLQKKKIEDSQSSSRRRLAQPLHHTKKEFLHKHALAGFTTHAYSFKRLELELELILSQMAQKPMLRDMLRG